VVEPELSKDGTELIYRFRGFRGQYKVSAMVEEHGQILEKDLEVEQDSEFFLQLN
jgi:hypothetical protein